MCARGGNIASFFQVLLALVLTTWFVFKRRCISLAVFYCSLVPRFWEAFVPSIVWHSTTLLSSLVKVLLRIVLFTLVVSGHMSRKHVLTYFA